MSTGAYSILPYRASSGNAGNYFHTLRKLLQAQGVSRQYRIIQVCGLRSKIFRQVVQINQDKADALPRFFGQADGIIFKQAVRLELCGVALILAIHSRPSVCNISYFFRAFDAYV